MLLSLIYKVDVSFSPDKSLVSDEGTHTQTHTNHFKNNQRLASLSWERMIDEMHYCPASMRTRNATKQKPAVGPKHFLSRANTSTGPVKTISTLRHLDITATVNLCNSRWFVIWWDIYEVDQRQRIDRSALPPSCEGIRQP